MVVMTGVTELFEVKGCGGARKANSGKEEKNNAPRSSSSQLTRPRGRSLDHSSSTAAMYISDALHSKQSNVNVPSARNLAPS